jgi:hypothetical protein
MWNKDYWDPIHNARDSTNKIFNGVPSDEIDMVDYSVQGENW